MRNIHCGPFGRRNTPMSCSLRSVSGNVVLLYLYLDLGWMGHSCFFTLRGIPASQFFDIPDALKLSINN